MNVTRLFSLSSTTLIAGLLLTPTCAIAQWSHDPASNFGVSTGGSDQGQVKIIPTADGGTWMCWLDGIGTGWDTRVQRLDARGIKQLGSNGVLVGDTALSSTNDYGFAIDASGNAVIAYRDDGNVSGGAVHAKVQKVDPAGNLLWGPTGVQVDAAGGVLAPHCCVTTDGGVVVGWTDSTVKFQKLDASGAPLWAAGGVSDALVTGVALMTDVIASDNGGAIAVYFKSSVARQVFARRFDSSGNKTWFTSTPPNVGPLPIFDESGNGVQAGTTIYMLPDGAGGAYISWYGTGGTRSSYVQHVTSAGVELFPHNGVKIATDIADRMRTSADISIDPSNGDIYMVSAESRTSTAGNYNIRAQRFNSAGTPQWNGGAGVELFPIGSVQPGFANVQAIPGGGGAIFSWYIGGFNTQVVQAARLNQDGSFAWTPGVLDVSSTLSGKLRLWSARNAAGTQVILAWSDNKAGGVNDIYAQNVRLDGSIGNPGDVNDDGVVNVADLLAVISTWGACPGAPTFCASDLTTAPRGDGQVSVADLLAVIANWG